MGRIASSPKAAITTATSLCEEQQWCVQNRNTVCSVVHNLRAHEMFLFRLTHDVNVRGDGGLWLLLHRLALSPLLLPRFSTMSLRFIINEEVCSWSIPHTNKIIRFCREIWRLKQSAGSLSLSLPTCSFMLVENPYFQLAVLATGGQSKLHAAAGCRAKTATLSLRVFKLHWV